MQQLAATAGGSLYGRIGSGGTGPRRPPSSAKDKPFCPTRGSPLSNHFHNGGGVFQSRLNAYENEELCAQRWGRHRRRGLGSPEPINGPLAPTLRALAEAFLRELQPYSHGIRGVKAAHWLRESGRLNIHLANTSFVALLLWLLSSPSTRGGGQWWRGN